MPINALCTRDVLRAKRQSDFVVACCTDTDAQSGIAVYAPFTDKTDGGNIYLDGMTDENVLERACDYLFSSGARAIVRAAYELNECGIIEARYKLSPVMLLHKLGIIDKCTIAGGVCLDNDDLDLMAQEGVPLVVLPTADAGYGHGYAPVCAALRRGVRVGVGTFDGKYNKKHSVEYELELLRLTANAEMRTENALSRNEIKKISEFK